MLPVQVSQDEEGVRPVLRTVGVEEAALAPGGGRVSSTLIAQVERAPPFTCTSRFALTDSADAHHPLEALQNPHVRALLCNEDQGVA